MRFPGHIATLLLILLLSLPAMAYRNVPALVHLNKTEQADTIGFNLVESLCSMLYPHVMSGSVPLYVSPQKELRIDATALQSLEKSSGTEFRNCPDIFFHEYWSSTRKWTQFDIAGVSFVNKNQLEEKVSFGFIDLADIDSLLRVLKLPNNADGNCGISYLQALYSRRYNYHLVQLGTENFREAPVEAVKRKHEAFYSGKEIRNLQGIPPCKEISYQVLKKRYSTDIDWSNELIQALQSVLKDNPEVFLNLGGERFCHFPDTLVKIPGISGLLIEETWVRENRKPRLKSARIKIFFAEGDLDWISLDELEDFGIMLHYKTLREILSDKPFEFDLIRVNDEEVDPLLGKRYAEALKKAPWNSLKAYVYGNF